MTDNELIQRCCAGQMEFMDLVIDRYKNSLYSLCRRMEINKHDADDLFQDTWVKAIKNIQGFSGKSSFTTWLYAICMNLYKDRYRKRQRWYRRIIGNLTKKSVESEAKKIESDEPRPDENVIKEEQLAGLRKCVQKLVAQ